MAKRAFSNPDATAAPLAEKHASLLDEARLARCMASCLSPLGFHLEAPMMQAVERGRRRRRGAAQPQPASRGDLVTSCTPPGGDNDVSFLDPAAGGKVLDEATLHRGVYPEHLLRHRERFAWAFQYLK